ncbi:MAG TPA: stress response translation initiation inhibitor YciH [Thermoanaerobaculia bacterium]
MTSSGRIVYSSGQGRLCPGCGWPEADCRCSKNLSAPDEPVPDKITARLLVENRGPGKHVTVVYGLPRNGPYLEALCRSLKKACGTGGAMRDSRASGATRDSRASGATYKGSIELQGDQRERLRELLEKKGIQVKG